MYVYMYVCMFNLAKENIFGQETAHLFLLFQSGSSLIPVGSAYRPAI